MQLFTAQIIRYNTFHIFMLKLLDVGVAQILMNSARWGFLLVYGTLFGAPSAVGGGPFSVIDGCLVGDGADEEPDRLYPLCATAAAQPATVATIVGWWRARAGMGGRAAHCGIP